MTSGKVLVGIFEVGKDPRTKRNIYMTQQCKKEFDSVGSAETRQFLRSIMKKFSQAISLQDEPQKKKFKRLGMQKTSGQCGDRMTVEFKRHVVRCYGCEDFINGNQSIILTMTSDRGKGGKGGKQSNDIETAAKRYGSWFDGK
jgi:hypothetical protein